MKKFIIVLLFLGNVFLSMAQINTTKERVAVLPPVAKDGNVTTIQKEIIRGSLTKALTKTYDYEAFTREDIDAITNEQKFQRSGMVDDDQRSRMGKLSGATLLCLSYLTLDGKDFYVQVSLIDVKTGKITRTADELMASSPNTEIQIGCDKLAEKLLGKSIEDVSKGAATPNMAYIEVDGVNDFYLGMTEITNEQYAFFLNAAKLQLNDAGKFIDVKNTQIEFKNDKWVPKVGFAKNPMIFVNWNGANEYCTWAGGRLPTVVEWDYASTGGKKLKDTKYAGSDNLDEVAWYGNNSGGKTHPVGTKKPNELDLYDMNGNVWEWTSDFTDKKKNSYVLCGGAWDNTLTNGAFVTRSSGTPKKCIDKYGFRVARTIVAKE